MSAVYLMSAAFIIRNNLQAHCHEVESWALADSENAQDIYRTRTERCRPLSLLMFFAENHEGNIIVNFH